MQRAQKDKFYPRSSLIRQGFKVDVVVQRSSRYCPACGSRLSTTQSKFITTKAHDLCGCIEELPQHELLPQVKNLATEIAKDCVCETCVTDSLYRHTETLL
jgi:hypothetical protein